MRSQRTKAFPPGGAIYVTTREELLSLAAWEEAGRPKMYLRVYDKGDIIIWEETGYGALKMQVGDKEATGRDIVTVGDVVAFGPYYEGALEILKPYRLIKA